MIAQVKQAERMMTHAAVLKDGIELSFADGCKGVIPFRDLQEIGDPANLKGIELPNPYEVNIIKAKGDIVELPWDFARNYCDNTYKAKEEAIGINGQLSLGAQIKAIRRARGISQSELANAAGIGRITEVRIENGEQSPRYETLVMISRALGLSLADVLATETIVPKIPVELNKTKGPNNIDRREIGMVKEINHRKVAGREARKALLDATSVAVPKLGEARHIIGAVNHGANAIEHGVKAAKQGARKRIKKVQAKVRRVTRGLSL